MNKHYYVPVLLNIMYVYIYRWIIVWPYHLPGSHVYQMPPLVCPGNIHCSKKCLPEMLQPSPSSEDHSCCTILLSCSPITPHWLDFKAAHCYHTNLAMVSYDIAAKFILKEGLKILNCWDENWPIRLAGKDRFVSYFITFPRSCSSILTLELIEATSRAIFSGPRRR